MGVVTGLLAFSTALSALLEFRNHCAIGVKVNSTPVEDALVGASVSTSAIRMNNGPGFIAISVATFLKGMSVLGHLALRAPPRRYE